MICCYRLSDFVLNIMNPFYLDLGFDLDTIAEVRKGVGVAMLMLGVGVGRLVDRALRADALPDHRRARGPDLEPGVRLARDAGAGSARLRARGHGGQRVRRLCRDGSDRLHVQPDQRRLHGDPVRAVLVAVFASRQADRGAVGRDRRGERAHGGAGRAVRRIDRPVLRPARRPRSPPAPPTSAFRAAALAAGYVVFFLYSCLVGLAALVLALVIAGKQMRSAAPGERAASAP